MQPWRKQRISPHAALPPTAAHEPHAPPLNEPPHPSHHHTEQNTHAQANSNTRHLNPRRTTPAALCDKGYTEENYFPKGCLSTLLSPPQTEHDSPSAHLNWQHPFVCESTPEIFQQWPLSILSINR